MRMQGYFDVYKWTILEADVARSQMFSSDTIKARNVHVEH